MRHVLWVLSLLWALLPAGTVVAADVLGIELNTAEPADNRCRLTFVIENKTERAVDSIKLDLAMFNPDGIVQRRMVVEMGPLRAAKTTVKTFAVDGDCRQLGAILVNDITACAPADAGSCLEGLALSSRVKNVRLYK
jgi:hypothetical protein